MFYVFCLALPVYIHLIYAFLSLLTMNGISIFIYLNICIFCCYTHDNDIISPSSNMGHQRSFPPSQILFHAYIKFYDLLGLPRAKSNQFLQSMKDTMNLYRPDVVCLLEPCICDALANEICKKLGKREWFWVDSLGFSGEI